MAKRAEHNKSKKSSKKVRFANDVQCADHKPSTPAKSGPRHFSTPIAKTNKITERQKQSIACLTARLEEFLPSISEYVARERANAKERDESDELFQLFEKTRRKQDNGKKPRKVKTRSPKTPRSRRLKPSPSEQASWKQSHFLRNALIPSLKKGNIVEEAITPPNMNSLDDPMCRKTAKIPTYAQSETKEKINPSLPTKLSLSKNKKTSSLKEKAHVDPIQSEAGNDPSIFKNKSESNGLSPQKLNNHLPGTQDLNSGVDSQPVLYQDLSAHQSQILQGNANPPSILFEISTNSSNVQKFRNGPPGMNSNIFCLLSKYGCRTAEAKLMTTRQVTWSSEQHWYLCGIGATGYPWMLSSADTVKNTAKALLRRSDIHIAEQEKKQKILDVNMIGDWSTFIAEEWKAYDSFRFATFTFLGSNALEKRVAEKYTTEEEGCTSFPGLVWSNNSCAYDSFLSILPHIATCIIQRDVYTEKLFGRNALCYGPVAMLTCAFDVLDAQISDRKAVSNWIRHLAIEFIRRFNPSYNFSRNYTRWTAFEESHFCDIGELYRTLGSFFVSKFDLLKHVVPIQINEIPSLDLSHVSTQEFKKKNSTSLPSLLFRALLHGSRTNPAITYMEPGIIHSVIILGTGGKRNNPEIYKWFATLFEMDWSGSFTLTDDDFHRIQIRHWSIALIAITGSSVPDLRHFVSATCHYEPEEHFQYHDGLNASGYVRKMKAVDVIDSKINLHETFIVACLKAEEEEILHCR